MSEQADLIMDRLQEAVGFDRLIQKLESGTPVRFYWGTAPTGEIHVGYLVALLKFVDLIRAGLEGTIFVADVHSLMDSNKTPSDLIDARSLYYETVIRTVLELWLTTEEMKCVTFIRGSEFQKSIEYVGDLFSLMSTTKFDTAVKAGTEVVKQSENPLLSNLIYPLMQSLDEKYLRVDAELGGVDQRKIFMFSRDRKTNHKITYLMNPILPGLSDGKMSASGNPNSKIVLDDSSSDVNRKLKKCFSIDGPFEDRTSIKDNGLLAVFKQIIFPFNNGPIVVDRKERFGGPVTFSNFEAMEDDFATGKIISADLKPAAAKQLNMILEPIRQKLSLSSFNKIKKMAYP